LQVPKAWVQFRYDLCRSGFNPYEFVLSPSTVPQLRLRWSYQTGSDVYSSPAVANGMLFIGSDDYNLYALNAATGTLVWKYTTGSTVRSSPSVANGVVYVG